ncbi:MAG: hypothetical protein QOJ89_4443 [bacterium]
MTTSTPPSSTAPRPSRVAAKLLAAVAIAGWLGWASFSDTFSSFSGVTANPAATLSAGTVTISDNDAGSALLALSNAKPGDTVSGCIVVSYDGTLPASVVLYGNTTGTGLDAYLDLKVTRGTISGTPLAGSCTNFTADSANYISQGAGVVYLGTLQGWPDTSATGLVDPTTASAATWAHGETHAYRLQVTLGSASAGQGKTVTQSFSWQAANT